MLGKHNSAAVAHLTLAFKLGITLHRFSGSPITFEREEKKSAQFSFFFPPSMKLF